MSKATKTSKKKGHIDKLTARLGRVGKNLAAKTSPEASATDGHDENNHREHHRTEQVITPATVRKDPEELMKPVTYSMTPDSLAKIERLKKGLYMNDVTKGVNASVIVRFLIEKYEDNDIEAFVEDYKQYAGIGV